jgi:hypothetical protein
MKNKDIETKKGRIFIAVYNLTPKSKSKTGLWQGQKQ